MKHINCAGSGAKRCASRLGHLTEDLSTTQVRKKRITFSLTTSLARDRGDYPSHGSLPQSKASESCTAALLLLRDRGRISRDHRAARDLLHIRHAQLVFWS